MSILPQTFVDISPRELTFYNVQLNQSYIQRVHLQNTLSYAVDIEIKAANVFRYTLSETKLTLTANQSKHIDIELTLTESISSKTLQIKDIFHIKSEFFNDHITASIIMANDNDHNQDPQTIADGIEYLSSSEITDTIHCNSSLKHYQTKKEEQKLREYIRSLENNVSELRIELDHLSTVKSQLNTSVPDLETIIDATISQERALNEVRNKKVLQILQTKDEEIETLKEMSRNYQAMEASLHVLQKKHVHLSQKYTEIQDDNTHLQSTLNLHKEEIVKLNEQIASYSQQSQFQKKIVHERDMRIKELSSDIQQTQEMLTKSTETMKQSYSEQIKELQSKLTESSKDIQRINNEFHEKEAQYKHDLLSCTQMAEENRTLKEYKDKQESIFKHELQHIQNDTFSSSTICDATANSERQINDMQIELAKMRAFVRLGLFNDEKNIIDYQKGNKINKEMMNELARKSAHLSASQAIIQQQRARINELEKVQKMSNHSAFEQSVKLNESNKKLSNNSSENQRLLIIHKRQIEILNKKLSAAIKREEESNIKLKNVRQKLNVEESDYVQKIEELEEALHAINLMHNKTKRKSSKHIVGDKDPINSHKLIEMVQLENKLMNVQHELECARKKLNQQMIQRKLDIKAHDHKIQNSKQLHEKQLQRLQSIIDDIKTNNVNVNRLMDINHELAQSETLKTEYLSDIQVLRNQLEALQQEQNAAPQAASCIDIKYNHTMNKKRDDLLLAINEKCFKQKEEIQDLENMMNAAISELKKYNPDIVHKLKDLSHNCAPLSSTTKVNTFAHESNDIHIGDQVTKIKHICDEEIERYQTLYKNIDDEYQTYKKKINQEIQQKDECYLSELAQQKTQITKLQSRIAELRKLNLNEEETAQKLRISNQSLTAKLEQYTEQQALTHNKIATVSILPSNDGISSSKTNTNDIKHMEEIITHQEAQIQVLMSTIETLQNRKPKKNQIVELSGRLAVHETLEAQRKKELEIMRSKWLQEQESKSVLEIQCGNIRAKMKSLKFKLQNNKQQNENIRNRFEHFQRQMIDKDNKIHELELTQSRLQSIRKQLESRANIMQSELDNLSKQHFQHLQTLSAEHQKQLTKLTELYGNHTHNDVNGGNNTEYDNAASMKQSLQTNVANDFHESLKSLSRLLEKYLIHDQELFDDEKRKLGLTSIEYASLMNNGIQNKSKALESIHTIQNKHQFMKQLMNIVNEQYGNILSLQKQAQFYEWLSRHHYTKRRESETNVLSIQCELQVNKKHLKRVKNDIDHQQLITQQQIQQRKDLMKEQMNKAIHRYFALETKCSSLKSEVNATKKQCKQLESKYYTVLNKLNIKNIDLEEKEVKLRQNISDEVSINASERDKKLKDYLHIHLKKIIEETVRRYEKNDLYENQVFELSNEILSLKYVQKELTQQLEKALFDNEDDKNQNKRLQEIIRSSNHYLEKMKQQQEEHKIKGTDTDSSTDANTMDNSICASPTKRSTQDVAAMELEQDLCDKKFENESLQNTIHNLQKEIEELLEQINTNKIKKENELKNMRQQIGSEREILIQNHHHQLANNHQQHQQKIHKLQNEMEQVAKRVRPWTDSLDLNQLKQTVESQTHQLSRSNMHLQTLRTKITQLEYELVDNVKELESQKFVIDHLQDTIKLFSANNEARDRASKPCNNLIISTLCKEMVQARKSQSNAMIKLRVASQSEIELQETISSREKRIHELKKHLNVKRGSSAKGQVIDTLKQDRKLDEMILEAASKDAEIRYLKKKLAIEQTKITVVYDIQPLQELVDKIDAYYYSQYGSKLPFKVMSKKRTKHNAVAAEPSDGDVDNLQNQMADLMEENKKLRDDQMKYITGDNKHDRLEIMQCRNKLSYLVSELNGYVNKIKSVCNVSLAKSSQRTTLKLKKIEDLCKLQRIKITACSDNINQLLMNVIESVQIVNEQYGGLQVAHNRLQEHIADEKTKYVELEQELDDIRITLHTYKSAEKTRSNIQICTHSVQTDDIAIDFETKTTIISLQNTIESLRKTKSSEAQDWREDVVSLHEQLLQSKIDVNRYKNECQELQHMYMELKSQLQHQHHPKCHHHQSPNTTKIPDHRLQLQSMEFKRKISSIQQQLNEANQKWKASETKYQKLLSHNIELKQESEHLQAIHKTTKDINDDDKQRLSELESICDTLQHEVEEAKSEYQKLSNKFQKIKHKHDKLKAKNDALNQKSLTIERRSDEETVKLREQLISAQSENIKVKDLVEELQHQITENESNINKIKCDKDADIQIKTKSHRSKIRDLRGKYDENIQHKDAEIKELKLLYEEEQEHHTQHLNKLMDEFDEYKDTQTRVQKMYEIQLNVLKKRFENAIIAEEQRLSFVNDSHSVHSSTASLRKAAKSPNNIRSRTLCKSQSISRICVSDYSSLLYDLSQRDAAIKSLKSELKSMKLALKKKEKEYQKLLKHKDKKTKAIKSCMSPKKEKTTSLFEIRASAVWSARLAHCTIQITELQKKLDFEQQTTIQKEEDVENYKFENKQLKLHISEINKKLEHQMNVKSKKNQTFECERQNWKNREKEWQQEKEKLNQNILQNKKNMKRLREDIHRKEDIMKQIKSEHERIKQKMESMKIKSKSMSFCHSDQYKELQKDIECMRNKVSLKENLFSDLKRKYEKLESKLDKTQTNNHELHSKNRMANSDLSRKDIMIHELKHKLENVERENISNKTQSDFVTKLKQKCKQLKNNESRKDELWRSNKQRLESVMKELNALKAQNEQKKSKIMTKLNKMQNDELCISKKYQHIKNEAVELKAVIDSLYQKLAIVNDNLIASLNDLQNNYYKKHRHSNKNKNKDLQSDDTLKAAQIVDGFSVNELEDIMCCNPQKENHSFASIHIDDRLSAPKTILWDKYEEKRCLLQLFEKVIGERVRLEMMIHKMKMHQEQASEFQNDQFEKIKTKHKQHLNEYQSMLKKVRKHK